MQALFERGPAWHISCYFYGMSADFYSPEFQMIGREQDRLQSISENIANSSMPGFKKLTVGDQVFDTLLNQSVDFYKDLREKGRFDPVFIDFTEGPLKQTERPLDFAVQGSGFFVVRDDKRDLYTRNGHFKVGPDGTLQNMDGMPVQGANGNIVVPPEANLSQLIAGPDGTIRDEQNNLLGTLKVVQFEDLQRLDRAGTALYSAPEDMPAREGDIEKYEVVHKTLEGSNTTIYDELAEMISCMRAFEANQRMVRTFDEDQSKMINTLGA
ncbi:MAG: flagellar hook basal-body protein [Kiritimatiellae bacterium]|nr:flagellar hook basal-body protein [Kiritimatiellia bacterium]